MAKLTAKERARQSAVRAYALNLGFDPDNLSDAQMAIVNQEIERTVGVALPPAAEPVEKKAKGKGTIAPQQQATPIAPAIDPQARIAELERQAEKSRLSMQRQAAMAGIAEGQGLSAIYQSAMAYGLNTQLASGFDLLSQKLAKGEQNMADMNAIGFVEGLFGVKFPEVQEVQEVQEVHQESQEESEVVAKEFDGAELGLWDEEDEQLADELEQVEVEAEAEIAGAIDQMGE